MSTNSMFHAVNEQGWRSGFSNLLRHENDAWWRSRRWWINTLIWLVIVNGILLAMLSAPTEGLASLRTPEQRKVEARTVFGVMAGLFGTIGAIIAVQGVIIDEKKSGTAAWIMSKPTSRTAFIAAKLIANVIATLTIILVVQGVVAYMLLSHYEEGAPPLVPFIGGLALFGLNQVFYLTLTLTLGTLFNDRGPVIGIPIGMLFGSMFLIGYLGQAAYLTPWLIIPSGSYPGLGIEVMLGHPLPTVTPIIATMVWIVIFIGITLWRFGREEF